MGVAGRGSEGLLALGGGLSSEPKVVGARGQAIDEEINYVKTYVKHVQSIGSCLLTNSATSVTHDCPD